MPWGLSATLRSDLPGAVELVVTGDPGPWQGVVNRVDGYFLPQPVRNFHGFAAGQSGDAVSDMEAPLGRPVSYELIAGGVRVAASGTVTCPPLPGGLGILRAVLHPAAWMPVEPQDEAGVEWPSSTTSYEIVGSDTPTVVGEVRQRHRGTMVFLVKSLEERDRLVLFLRDGLPYLLRHDPCASQQTGDILFYARGVRSARWQRAGWHLVAVDYQSTAFVPGDTDESPEGWNWGALKATGMTWGQVYAQYRDWRALFLNEPREP